MNIHAETLLNQCHRGGGFSYLWKDKPKLSKWFDVQQRPEIPNSKAINIYFGVHPTSVIPTDNARGETVDQTQARSRFALISAVNVIFAEFDAKDEILETEYSSRLPENLAMLKADEQKTAIKTAKETACVVDIATYKSRALARVEQVPLCPTMLIDSGGGYHCYWFLAETVFVNDSNRERIKAIQAAWVDSIGGDPACKDLARVLRVPGTWNVKEHFKPNFPQVKVIEYEETRLYSLADFEEVLNRVSPVDDIEAAALQAHKATADRPYDDVIAEFNRTHNIVDLLTAHGYQISRNGGSTTRLSRPGRDKEQSSVIVFLDVARSYHHSSSDLLHTDQHTRDAFDIWTQLEHSGDTKRAYEAAKRAQGKWTDPVVDAITVIEIKSEEVELEDDDNPLDIPVTKDLALGWVSKYVELMSRLTASPAEFHQLAGLVTAATAIQRRARLRMAFGDIYPNVYACIVAPSTVYGKTTAISRPRSVLQAAMMGDLLIPSHGSSEGLISTLAQKPNALMVRDEIGTLFGSDKVKYLKDYKQDLTYIYDCNPYSRALSQQVVSVEKPYLNILGATTPGRFYSNITTLDWQDGLLPRWLFALPDSEPDFDSLTGAFTEQHAQEITKLAHQLMTMNRQQDTDFVLDGDSYQMWAEWRKQGLKLAYTRSDETAMAIIGRYATYALKFALILAATNESWGTITESTMQTAIKLADNYKHNVYRIINEADKHQVDGSKLQKIFGVIKRHQQKGTVVTSKTLMQFAHMKRSEVDPVIEKLKSIGAIMVDASGRTPRYVCAVEQLPAKQW